jgi:hypothetical protein
MWWTYIVVPALLAVGIYGFVLMVRVTNQKLGFRRVRRHQAKARRI